ncbi:MULTISPECIES: DEAD/DEAH box helicase [Mesonia]|uniref:DEAD-box ATP-dependent RNA helicase CshE n=1 Tax=Mesonia oceanica TaxID=2687242 RepID=A0AC61Y586_9FLAO|nr:MULTISPECIES: DEAD/DEAH box helicase [Mesonia]MAN26586.1 DEAD/DEAH box helicase [Mesonia sp.]MAQ40854.1 DEAD/DEAH box helicase [Mesonia sp.]MBJ97775.1 DEAD/DEAH box helicase [Flavobacteriaceae bacterium]VVU99483.1 DEAD-box ATP-dependent RNA helicase CshE [Mesonia oceanica]|tara:strand:- start:6276 stop:7391 length:1116 start_codon:yes stop_codon:yes gene_type:complete
MQTFQQLGIHKDFVKGLNELGIVNPTEIQEETIPELLNKNTDFIGQAPTGTGKTAAYGLPILQDIEIENKVIQALILAPTRELAQQIKKQLFKFTKYVEGKIFTEEVYGGEKIQIQINNLKRPTHIVVATPGRLLDLIERGAVNLKHIKTLVLDEADEMLSMGFKEDLDKILKYTGNSKNTWLFSATMPAELDQLIKKYMSPKAIRVEPKNDLINKNITHQYIQVSRTNKDDVLINLLDQHQQERGIIFTRTKAGAQKLVKSLKDEGFSVEALEGNMQQRDREKVMRAFKKESLQFLVSTDVSARGIDVNNLAFVIHYQLPESLAYYTHRSGRTARGGNSGISIALILPHELPQLKEIEQKLQISFKEKAL